MNIYFIRHGETEFNAKKIHQHVNAELSEVGMRQAEFVAKRLMSIPIDAIFSSDSVRALQTTDVIAKAIGKEVITSELLKEIKRPSEIVGMHQDDPVSVAIRSQIREHFLDKDWHYADEENFFDAYDRAKKALAFVQARGKENVLVVTHGVFMKLLVATLMLGEELTPQIYLAFSDFLATRNTGITWCTQDEKSKWHLVTWNDHAHLGDYHNKK